MADAYYSSQSDLARHVAGGEECGLNRVALAVSHMVITVPEQTTTLLSDVYLRWQKRLAQAFFADRRGQPIVMFVDRDELHELADNGEDGPRSLTQAVLDVIDVARGASMFARVTAAQRVWQSGDQQTPPPTLPVLAVSVLAASEMGSDAAGAGHNYYIRLAAALLPDAPQESVEQLRHELSSRGAFLAVVTMWKKLSQWLESHDGEYGVSTIPADLGHFSRIGYPLSQTLMRRSDRAALTRFFDRMHLTRIGVPGPDTLLFRLQLWTSRRPQGYSDRFREALTDSHLQDLLRPLVHDLAKSWDGEVVTAEGLRRLEIRLAIDIDRGETWWVIPAGRDDPADVLSGSSEGVPFAARITPDRHTAVYQVEGLPPVRSAALRDGMFARGLSCVADFRPSDLFVFVESADAGGWLSVDAVQAYEEHVFAARLEDAPDVEAALSRAADDTWQRLKDPFADQLLSGYAIYYGIAFSDEERLAEAIDLLPRKVVGNLQLGTTLCPRLINGLPLLQSIGRNIYLAGGEPDLELPLGVEQRRVPVVLDGSSPQLFLASIFPIPFSVILRGEVGTHTIEADGEILNFDVIDGEGSDCAPPSVGGLGWTGGQIGAATEESVCGALTPTDYTTPFSLIRRAALEYWVADHTGHLMPLNEPGAPTFLPDASFAYFEVAKERGCWVLQRRIRGWQVTRLTAREPSFRALTRDAERVWQEAAKTVRTSDRLWPLYIAAAERARGF